MEKGFIRIPLGWARRMIIEHRMCDQRTRHTKPPFVKAPCDGAKIQPVDVFRSIHLLIMLPHGRSLFTFLQSKELVDEHTYGESDLYAFALIGL